MSTVPSTKSLINEAMNAVATGDNSATTADNGPGNYEETAVASTFVAEANPEEHDQNVPANPDPVTNTAPVEVEDFIYVTDDKGRRKVKVDYADKGKVKKAFELAAGMRKFQAERDKVTTNLESTKAELAKYQERFAKLESAWETGKEDGIIRLLSGNQRSLDHAISERAERQKLRESADPADLVRMDAEEALRSKDSTLQKMEARIKQMEEAQNTNMAVAETQKMEAMVYPQFDKFRFTGKVADEEAAETLDTMMFERATKAFDTYASQGVMITPEVVEREFKRLHGLLSRTIKQEAEKKVSSTIEQKKNNALGNAQTQMNSAMTSKSYGQKAQDALNNGDIKSFFRNITRKAK